jgi:hypothetical protein
MALVVAPDDAWMDAPPPDFTVQGVRRFATLSDEDMAKLQEEVLQIQKKLGTQEELTVEEEKKINIWFRERRGVAMSVVKEKVTKVKADGTPRTPRKPAVKRVTKAQIKQEALGDIFSGIFG